MGLYRLLSIMSINLTILGRVITSVKRPHAFLNRNPYYGLGAFCPPAMEAPLITVFGGSGSIGRPLSRYLAENGYRIRIADVREPTDMPPGAEFFKCDIRDPGAVRKALDGVDFALSLAIIQIPVINERRRLAYEVNIQGTVNVCEAVDELPDVKGMLLAGTWHVFGEMGLQGPIDEGFGFRPDKVEPRARLYALHKVCQEVIVRIYDEMSDKVFGVIRQGTVLGEVMPEKTAANIFINKALRGEAITPYRHSAHRPMLFIYIGDLCRAYKAYIDGVLQGSIRGTDCLLYTSPSPRDRG